MFRFHKTLDVITLFHKTSSQASKNVYNILKKASADSSSASCDVPGMRREQFELEITEELPTRHQLNSILEYVGAQNINTIVKGAHDEESSWKRLLANSENLQRPLIVDWDHGRVTTKTEESEILKIINS